MYVLCLPLRADTALAHGEKERSDLLQALQDWKTIARECADDDKGRVSELKTCAQLEGAQAEKQACNDAMEELRGQVAAGEAAANTLREQVRSEIMV